jgi:Holliday junction resolvase
MNDYERQTLEDFFKTVEPYSPCYKHACFSYLALRRGEAFQLAQGRLQLQAVPVPTPSACFESENIRAGIFRLNDSGLSPRDFVDRLLSGKFETPYGELHFPPEEGRFHSVYFVPYHSDGLSTQRRQIHLGLTGDRRQRSDGPSLDWELKAAPTPFFNVQELCDAFSVGAIRGDYSSVDITALPVAAISPESVIEGPKVRLAMDLAEGLHHHKASIGYRIFERNRVARRGALSGSSLTWTDRGDVQHGSGEIEAPAGAIIDCIANYSGVAQQHYWIADPRAAQNPLRSVHHAFDNNLEVLRELIDRSEKKGADARDLEMAMSWLLWLLGFSPTRIGGTGKTSDAPDLIAATPAGNLVVIECTTGILKEDSKLSHLFQRAEKVRQSLAASGSQHLRVLPVIVTTKTRDEVKSELDQAYKLGVLVATREDLPKLIDRTIFFPDPNGLYTEAEESLRRLQKPSAFGLAE